MISFKLPNKVAIEDLPLQIILHTNEIEKMWINGEKIDF